LDVGEKQLTKIAAVWSCFFNSKCVVLKESRFCSDFRHDKRLHSPNFIYPFLQVGFYRAVWQLDSALISKSALVVIQK